MSSIKQLMSSNRHYFIPIKDQVFYQYRAAPVKTAINKGI